MALVTVQRSPTPSTSSSPCVSESGSGEDDRRSQPRSISESFLTVKGAALFLPRGNGSSLSSASRFSQLRSKHAGDIQQHLQTMFTLLRPEDNIKLAVRLESVHQSITRYMVVVSTNGRQDTEESVVLGMDFSPVDGSCSVGLVLALWSDTLIHLDGDGGFSVSTDSRVHVFKPVSVQAMWSALQSLHKACEVARGHNYFPGSLFLTWVSYYQSRVYSDQTRINEWNAMQDVQSHRADSPVLFSDIPTERELTERQIKTRLREIMMQKDLENVTSKEIRTELEMNMTCNLREFKEYIDNEMIVILGQMDSPTEIFDHVFLGSEWNASNLEELQNSGVQYILNVTREIDNFFPGVFEYHNIRVYDEEATDLLAYWNETYKFITRAKKAGSKCLVHCKMGVSRSAATVIAYAMKEYGWDLIKAFDYVKERRAVTKPNPSFMRQLEEYQGILLASKQRHNKLWRSHSDSDLSEHHEPLSKSHAQPHSLGRNPAGGEPGPSVKELLESLGSAGKATQTASQPDTGVHSASFDGAAALMGGVVARSPEGPRPGAVGPGRLDRPRSASALCSVPPSSPPLSNGLSEAQEPPASPPPSPPLSRPRAATVVPPPAQKTDAPTVAESVPVGQPHPPPSLHRLPPSTAPSPCTDEGVRPEPMATKSPSAQSAGPACASPPVPVKNPDCDQRVCSPPLGGVAARPRSASRFASDPGAIPQDGGVLFGHSADHINFFSAREKFKGMSQDGKAHVAAAQSKSCAKEQQPPPAQEEEKIKETTVPLLSAELKPDVETNNLSPLSLTSRQETADRQVSSAKEAENVKEEVKNKEEEGADAAQLCSDWTRGSVRRATRQLEQRMKQEHETPTTSSSPPPTESATQRRAPAVQEEQEEDDGGKFGADKMECGDRVAMGSGGSDDKSTNAHRLPPGDARLLSTSYPYRYLSASPFASVNFLCLEGVTELESATDWDGGAAEAPAGDIIMRETWETLCELGAFLQQVSTGAAGKTADQVFGAGGSQSRGSSLQKRVREVEARIRQAGLTPPSLMKRSASLAKLGCLELLVNDLNEWELSRAAVSPPAAQPLAHAGDESKKQRVHACPAAAEPQPEAPGADAEELPEAGESPTETPPSYQCLQGGGGGEEGGGEGGEGGVASCSPDQPSSGLATRQQYGRTHPLRRLKKRTVSTLYHTM